jgi:hypothetical protein
MSLSALALAALLTAQPLTAEPLTAEPLAGEASKSLTSGATSVSELHLRAPRVASQNTKAKRPPIVWSRDPSGPRPARAFVGRRDFVIYPLGANCKSALQKARGAAVAETQPLSKMPNGHLEFAVARLVDGCPVAAVMRADDKIR